MVTSTWQLLSRPAAVVNCHCTPSSSVASTGSAGLPPAGAPSPRNGITTVTGAAVTVSGAWGA